MKHSDFFLGLEFLGVAGFRWRCTDIGLRTILAIQLDRDDPLWYEGPPYIAEEVVFDEQEIEYCHLTASDALKAAVYEHKSSGHPGYPAEAIRRMLEVRHAHRYPHEGVLRFDRCRPDGEILHPYAGRKEGRDLGGRALPAVLKYLRRHARVGFHCVAARKSTRRSCPLGREKEAVVRLAGFAQPILDTKRRSEDAYNSPTPRLPP